LKTYSYSTCDITVTHDESAVRLGSNKLNIKDKPKPNSNLNPNLTLITT